MADADTFGVELIIDVGADTATARKNLADFEQQCKDLGKTAEETKNHLIAQLKEIARFVDPNTGGLNEKGKALIQLYDKDQAAKDAKAAQDAAKAISDAQKKHLQDAQREAAKIKQQMRGMGKMLGNPFEFLSAGRGFNLAGFLNRVSRTSATFAPFANVFNNYRAVWHFVDSIAQLNKEIMRLAITSGMGAGELKNLGNAAEAFGGSAATIAAGNERFVKTVEDMKRGGGLGFLGTIAYKYGFMADLGADWQTNTQRAIEMARGMDVNTRMAFLKDFDSSNYKQNMAYASMDEDTYRDYMSRMNTPEKSEAAQGATDATRDYLMSTSLLSSAWQQICDQLAEVLLPVMEKIVDFATWLVECIGALPKGLTATIAAVTGIVALLKTINLIWTAINMAKALSVKLGVAEGVQTKKNTALTWLGVVAELAKTMAKNPFVGAAALVAVAGIAAGAGVMIAQGNREERQERRRQEREKWERENISFDKLVSGEQKMTPQEQLAFGFNLERMFQSSVKGDKYYNFNAPEDSLNLLSQAAIKAADAMNETSGAAKDMADAIQLSAMSTEASVIYNRVSGNTTTSQTNVNMNNVFENASTEELGEAFDMFAAQIREASRSGVA